LDRRREEDLLPATRGLASEGGGRKQLAKDAAYWQRVSDAMGRILTMSAESGS